MSNATAKQPTIDQRIRGTELAVLIKAGPVTSGIGVPFEEGLARADKDNRVIASNKRMSMAMAGVREAMNILEAFPCWIGTITAYAEPGEKLGKAIEYVDPETRCRWIFPVPEKYQDKKNAILVAEHPYYTLEFNGRTRLVRAAQVDFIERFPFKDGWYMGDAIHDIPSGDGVSASNPAARFLYRTNRRVGSVVRDIGTPSTDVRRNVYLFLRPSNALGVAVEAP